MNPEVHAINEPPSVRLLSLQSVIIEYGFQFEVIIEYVFQFELKVLDMEWEKVGATMWKTVVDNENGSKTIDFPCYVIGLKHPSLKGVFIPEWLVEDVRNGL